MYQVVRISENYEHAGSKAPADVSAIAENMGFQKLYLRDRTLKRGIAGKAMRQIGWLQNWLKCCDEAEEGSVLLMQHPLPYRMLFRNGLLRRLKREKHVKFISPVHDISEPWGQTLTKKNKIAGNVAYHGSFPTDDIHSQLKEGFGLVWDGEGIDGCIGPYGKYLRYNSPP